jgi:integrase
VFADGYAPPLSPITIENRRHQLLLIATAVVKTGFPADQVVGLASLVEAKNAKAALQFFYERAGRQKTEALYNHAGLLRGIARHWVKADVPEREVIESLCRRLAVKKSGMTAKNRMLLRQFDDPANVDALLNLPSRILAGVKRIDRGGRRDPMRVMFAVAIEFLIMAPMRIKNLTSLEIGRHIVRTSHGTSHVVHLVVPGEEVKNGEPLELPLPQETADLLDLYLLKYHARLGHAESPWLFPGRGGNRQNTEGFSGRISEFILRETGIRMHVHLFRHLAVKLHCTDHPEDVETARRILGHRSIKTTLRAYSDFKTTTAHKQYDGTVSNLRESFRKPSARRSGTAHGAP